MRKTEDFQTEFKYISFVQDTENYRHFRTSVWMCRNIRSGDSLGVVRWYGPWRQYCFYPSGETIFNKGCLIDIQTFIEQLSKRGKRPTKEEKRIEAEVDAVTAGEDSDYFKQVGIGEWGDK